MGLLDPLFLVFAGVLVGLSPIQEEGSGLSLFHKL